MKDLIEALTIFAKYLKNDNEHNPTHCEHDQITIMSVGHDEISAEDRDRLGALGFFWSETDDGAWISFRFGSA